MYNSIRPGKEWLDTKRVRIEAHGGSVIFDGGKYWWYGEDKSHTSKKGKIWTWGIHCYSSTDLMNWTDEGFMVPPEPYDEKSLFYPTRRLDRPHLIKNARTGKYVLWLKYCDKSHFVTLTADSLLGPYTVVEPFLQPYGAKSGDFDLAVDSETGDAYIYFEANHDSVLAAKLNADYTNITGQPKAIYSGMKPPFAREGIAHFEHGGRHYIISSGMTGYVPNPSEIAVSDDWMGDFKVLGNPHVDDKSSASFNSQPCDVFRVEGTDTLVVMADRWVPEYVMMAEKYDVMMRAIASRTDKSVKATFKEKLQLLQMPLMGSADTSKANYVWLPIEWDGEMPLIKWKDAWTV